MAVQQPRSVQVRATFEVLVTRDARGDLTDGVHDRLRKVAVVEHVEHVEISGLTPGLNDLRVEATAELRLSPEAADTDDAALEALLEEGFGVTDADVARAD
jgi:translation elongation factor EF-1beta